MVRGSGGANCGKRCCLAQLLGPDLAFVIQKDKHFDFFACADRMLTAVESFHRCGFVHRDIKPGAPLLYARVGSIREPSQDRDPSRCQRMHSPRTTMWCNGLLMAAGAHHSANHLDQRQPAATRRKAQRTTALLRRRNVTLTTWPPVERREFLHRSGSPRAGSIPGGLWVRKGVRPQRGIKGALHLADMSIHGGSLAAPAPGRQKRADIP